MYAGSVLQNKPMLHPHATREGSMVFYVEPP